MPIKAGQSVQFSAEVRDSEGNVLDRPVEWDVRRDDVFSVDQTGVVRAGSYVDVFGTARPPAGATVVIARSDGAMDSVWLIPLPAPLLLEVTPMDTTVLAVGESAEFTLAASMPPEPELWSTCRTPGLRPDVSGVVWWEALSTVTEYPDGVWVSRSVYRATGAAPGVTGLEWRVFSTYCFDQRLVGDGPRPAIRVIE
ncbi:MAG: hypothetical protein KY466_02260 [Gemmatimonadetes bacterium]|nr:hypothetical protein [Gemmatimonadota bacterium]